MRTGRFRFRTGFRGRQVLQLEYDGPMLTGPSVDASIRMRVWRDADVSEAQDLVLALDGFIARPRGGGGGGIRV